MTQPTQPVFTPLIQSQPTVALPRLVAGNISEMASVTLDNDGGSGWLSFGTDPDDYEDWLDHDVVDAYTAYLDSINGFYDQFPKYPSFNDGQNTNNDLAHMYWAFDTLQTTMCYYAGRLSEMAVLRTSCLEQTNSTVSAWQAYWQSVPSDITHAGNNDTVIPDLWPDPQMITVAQEVCAL